jgi:hypothetical protein
MICSFVGVLELHRFGATVQYTSTEMQRYSGLLQWRIAVETKEFFSGNLSLLVNSGINKAHTWMSFWSAAATE